MALRACAAGPLVTWAVQTARRSTMLVTVTGIRCALGGIDDLWIGEDVQQIIKECVRVEATSCVDGCARDGISERAIEDAPAGGRLAAAKA